MHDPNSSRNFKDFCNRQQTQAAEKRLINAMTAGSSSDIDAARNGLNSVNRSIAYNASFDAYNDERRAHEAARPSGSGDSGDSVIPVMFFFFVGSLALAAVVEVCRIIYHIYLSFMEFVSNVFSWLGAHMWNIVGAGMIVIGVIGLYFLAGHFYWKYRRG